MAVASRTPAAPRTAIERILDGVPLPDVVPVEQRFDGSPIGDLPAAVEGALKGGGLADMVRPGQRVALAVGSRGLANLPDLVRLLAAAVRRLGAEPFAVPAMGSHGGATAEGQVAAPGQDGGHGAGDRGADPGVDGGGGARRGGPRPARVLRQAGGGGGRHPHSGPGQAAQLVPRPLRERD